MKCVSCIQTLLKCWRLSSCSSLLDRINNKSGSYIRPTTQSPVAIYLFHQAHTPQPANDFLLAFKNKADVGHFRSCIHLWPMAKLLEKAEHEKKTKANAHFNCSMWLHTSAFNTASSRISHKCISILPHNRPKFFLRLLCLLTTQKTSKPNQNNPNHRLNWK